MIEPEPIGSIPIICRFPIELELPLADPVQFAHAARALEQEYVGTSTHKLLHCCKTSVIAERDQAVICVIQVEGEIDFDWTWEGATAFCPTTLEINGDGEEDFTWDKKGSDRWSGEILEVDEMSRSLYIGVADRKLLPDSGPFLVRPYEYLAALNAIYQDGRFETLQPRLNSRLTATEKPLTPAPLTNTDREGLEHLQEWWQHGWATLWGPPGTGKTYTIGRQIAAVLSESDHERVLIVSTTNRATDAVAVSIGEAAKEFCPDLLEEGSLLRIGKELGVSAFEERELESMLVSVDNAALHRINQLSNQIEHFDDFDDRALMRQQLLDAKSFTNDRSRSAFVDPDVRAVVSTSFRALMYLHHDDVFEALEGGYAPFTTIIIDEAGLISRVAVAALSLLASRRVVLVGDSRQLAPISKVSRVLPSFEKKWIASSALSHLDDISQTPASVHTLLTQYRMHPEIGDVVSAYQYSNRLVSADETIGRISSAPSSIINFSRAIWYVLDQENIELSTICAQPGPGNKSRIRPVILDILERLFQDPDVRSCEGMFVTPYRAQAQLVASFFQKLKLDSWQASTVHSQQGSEADVVIFDTVSAGSCHWPFEEWKRLVNVGISRAREAVIVVTSEQEMEEPYLRGLASSLQPAILSKETGCWQVVEVCLHEPREQAAIVAPIDTMGYQIAERQRMHPVMSADQQRLIEKPLDGRARLVRGVVGSGKSLVLAHWLAKTAARTIDQPDYRIWAVYANRSLHSLFQQGVQEAWFRLKLDRDFPWQKVELIHINTLLDGILSGYGVSTRDYDFDYNEAAYQYLHQVDRNTIVSRCDALFVDEAQDIGQSVMELLFACVQDSGGEQRPAHVFYDSAQNLYDRQIPDWDQLKIEAERRDLLSESYRSSRPILEFAINVVNALPHRTDSPQFDELFELGLLEQTTKNGQPWLVSRFNQVHGAKPQYYCFSNQESELEALSGELMHLITTEYVQPKDIVLIYNNQEVATQLIEHVEPKLREIEVQLSVQARQDFVRRSNTLIATTAHSFKGHASEVVIIPCADRFVGNDLILANSLFVAMTRARSHLSVYSSQSNFRFTSAINRAFRMCLELEG